MLLKELQNFGLSEKEAKVYLASLELGTATIQELSQKSNVNRATTYIQVESLQHKGLISTVDKDKKSLFMAERPEKLLTILEEKKNTIEVQESKIRKLIPDFEALYNVADDKPRVRFFEGMTGMASWQADMYKQSPKEVDLIMPLLDDFEKMAENPFFLEKMFRRVEKIRFLVPVEKKEFLKSWPKAPNFTMKYHKLEGYKTEMVLYNGKVFLNKPIYKKPISVLLEEKSFYQSFLVMFNHFWDEAED